MTLRVSRTKVLQSPQWRARLRTAGAVAGAVGCVLATHNTLQAGFSRANSEKALMTGSVAEATNAVRMNPADPENYKNRAMVLAKHAELDLAVEDLRTALRLRPEDYNLWSRLGSAFTAQGDPTSALAAFIEAQRLAPAYGTTNWDLGLTLIQLGHHEEGFRQLRIATLNNPALRPGVFEMAWKTYRGDLRAVAQAIDPRNSEENLELARFFIKQAAPDQVVSFASLEKLTPDDRQRLIRSLVEAKRFNEAWTFWKASDPKSAVTTGVINDGNFESGQLRQESAFAWDLSRPESAIKISVEQNSQGNSAVAGGNYYLQMKWDGNPKSDEPISQLILVAPNTTYELTFKARAQDLITGGAPIVQITDVSQKDNVLARSSDLPVGTSDWQRQSVQFTTGPAAQAVRIGIRRNSCSQQPCPIFGTLSVDDFSLERINTPAKNIHNHSLTANKPSLERQVLG